MAAKKDQMRRIRAARERLQDAMLAFAGVYAKYDAEATAEAIERQRAISLAHFHDPIDEIMLYCEWLAELVEAAAGGAGEAE